MIKILLACSAGMSTSSLEANMNKYIKEQKLPYQVKALGALEAKAAFASGEKWDIVLLGPQVGYMKNDFHKIVGNAVLDVIPPAIYALAKGKETVNLVIKLLENKG